MDFGKLPDIDGVDFTLPPDPPDNAELLASAPRVPEPTVVVGCPSWNHPEWMGKVYAQGKKSREFLPEYVQQFNGIEVNATAYNMPSEEKVETWALAATPGFKYCVKFPQTITHYGGPLVKINEAKEFVRRVERLGAHLGPSLLQFSENFGPKRLPDVSEFLRQYRGSQPVAVEMRHQGYFTSEGRTWLDTAQALNALAVITDTAGRRDVVHMRLTVPMAFIRFTGNNLHATDYQRLDAWVNRIDQWLKQGIHAVYFFVHTSPKLNCPDLAGYFIDRLMAKTGVKVKRWRKPTDSLLF